jgi:hypothetical protein
MIGPKRDGYGRKPSWQILQYRRNLYLNGLRKETNRTPLEYTSGASPLEPAYAVSHACVIVAFGRIANGTGKLEGTGRNEDRKGCRMEKNLFPSDFQPDFPVFTTDVRGFGGGQDSEEHAASFPLHILIPLTFS